MPVHFKIAPHSASPVTLKRPLASVLDLACDPSSSKRLHHTDPLPQGVGPGSTAPELLQSTFSHETYGFEALSERLIKQKNGFVHTIVDAYTGHHHLVLRPDDIWIAILTQFNIYVNAHAEELRSQFVAHQGKKDLLIRMAGTRYQANFADFATQMTELIHENIVDPDLREWVLPNFSTTNPNDMVICSITMMSTLKSYFTYTMSCGCGLPSVKLEGVRSDYTALLSRLPKLASYGPQPAHFAALLHPILTRFVRAFDGERDTPFWNRVCSVVEMGSLGGAHLSGWVTAFCVWGEGGRWLGEGDSLSWRRGAVGGRTPEAPQRLVLDGVTYPVIYRDDVAVGCCEVGVRVVEEGVGGGRWRASMVAGHGASLVLGGKGAALRPYPAWFIVLKGKDYQHLGEEGE